MMTEEKAFRTASWMVLALGALLAIGLAKDAKAGMLSGNFTHDDLAHDSAHYGAGTAIAQLVHAVAIVGDFKPKKRTLFVMEVGAAFEGNVIYEMQTRKLTSPDAAQRAIAWERIFFGTLGGLVFAGCTLIPTQGGAQVAYTTTW